MQFEATSNKHSLRSNARARVVRTVSLCQTENLEKRPGLIESLQNRYVLEGLETEALLDDPTRGFADDQRSRHRDGLQASGKVDRRSDRLAVPNHDLSGRDANPHAQAEPANCIDDLQAGMHRPAGGVFAGDGKSKVAHSSVVALRIVGRATAARDDLVAAFVILGKDLAVLLGTHRRKQPRRSDKIERHDCDLAQIVLNARTHIFYKDNEAAIAVQFRLESGDIGNAGTLMQL